MSLHAQLCHSCVIWRQVNIRPGLHQGVVCLGMQRQATSIKMGIKHNDTGQTPRNKTARMITAVLLTVQHLSKEFVLGHFFTVGVQLASSGRQAKILTIVLQYFDHWRAGCVSAEPSRFATLHCQRAADLKDTSEAQSKQQFYLCLDVNFQVVVHLGWRSFQSPAELVWVGVFAHDRAPNPLLALEAHRVL